MECLYNVLHRRPIKLCLLETVHVLYIPTAQFFWRVKRSPPPFSFYETLHFVSPPQDGRLRTGDQLVEINGEQVLKLSHNDIISRLRAISKAGETLRVVVSREGPPGGSDGEDDVSDLDVSVCVYIHIV